MARRASGELAISTDARPRRRVPALTAAFVTLLYAIAYLVWERNDWGTPVIRNLISNVAFMPLNLAVVTLTFLASRSPVLDPGVRRALRLLALGSAMVFIGNAISTWYLMVLHQNPPVSWADLFYLSDSLLILAALLSFPLARRTRLERWKFVLDAAMVLVGGAVAIWYFSIRPTAGATENSSIVITLLAFAYPLVSMLVLLGITTAAPAAPDRRQPGGVRPAGRGGVHQRRRRPDLQPGLAGDRRPEREHHRRRVPALLRDADRQRRAVLPPAGAALGGGRDAAAAATSR